MSRTIRDTSTVGSRRRYENERSFGTHEAAKAKKRERQSVLLEGEEQNLFQQRELEKYFPDLGVGDRCELSYDDAPDYVKEAALALHIRK